MNKALNLFKGMDKKLYGAANLTVKWVGCVIFFALSWYALRYTHYMLPDAEEAAEIMQDSVLTNLLCLVFAICAFTVMYLLSHKVKLKYQARIKIAMLVLSMVWVAVFCTWWIISADRVPQGDQAFIYGAASYYQEGNYMFFQKGGYMSLYPFQLGLVSLYELIFMFAGPYNYLAIELIHIPLAVGIVYLGYVAVNKLTDSVSAALFYCGSMMFCFPLFFYTSWVYGDIPSIFFSLMAYVCLLQLEETEKKRWCVLFSVFIGLAVLVRQTSWIFVVAVVLAGAVQLLRKRSKLLIIALALAVVIPRLMFSGVFAMYEHRSGQEVLSGIPKTMWIAMGMQESAGRCGWYNDYNKRTFYELDCNSEAAAAVAKQEIRDRMDIFLGNPEYARFFLREKILSQWNQPLYQSLFFNTTYAENNSPDENSLVYRVGTELYPKFLQWANRMQIVIYVGMLGYFALCVKRSSNVLHHVIAISIIGGFLFSIMWEAKARYILPYYIMMFPLAAAGYRQMISAAAGLYRKYKKPKEKDNIIEFKKIA